MLTSSVAAQVRYWRERRRLSAADLEARTAELGHRLNRSVIANLENKRRDTVSVAELLVLAAALDVPPNLLIAPVGAETSVEILPEVSISPWQARGWLLGAIEPPYPGSSPANWRDSQRAIVLYDLHRRLVREHEQIERRTKQLAEQRSDDLGEDGMGHRLGEAITELAYSISRIQDHRHRIAAEGFELPDLPASIAVRMPDAPTGRHHRRSVGSTSEGETLAAPLIYEAVRTRRESDRQVRGPSDSEP
jgi:transcriptional regulator with XRE-family HTH domain